MLKYLVFHICFQNLYQKAIFILSLFLYDFSEALLSIQMTLLEELYGTLGTFLDFSLFMSFNSTLKAQAIILILKPSLKYYPS